ncbi:MAG: hypothetical protein P8R37_03285 [Opitutae bacterium]|nr:hypothetical protein [Opitutae bacterium]MDG1300592.1 hypothetical protein [Opitutae bacterium]
MCTSFAEEGKDCQAKPIQLAAVGSSAPASFKHGDLQQDDQGIHINAHGGGVLLHDGAYYWYCLVTGSNVCVTFLRQDGGLPCLAPLCFPSAPSARGIRLR